MRCPRPAGTPAIRARALLAAIAAAQWLAPAALAAQPADRLREPLPLEVAAAVRGHDLDSPIEISPDGLWLAHTVVTPESMQRDTVGFVYTATGYSLASGERRTEVWITHTRTGESIRPGGAGSASGSPAWSPDGRRVAFVSDEGGQTGLWIWERQSRTAARVPGLVVRQLFKSEGPRWSTDGRRILIKALPDGVTIAEANARDIQGRRTERFPPVEPGQPSVIVQRVVPREAAAGDAADAADDATGQPPAEPPAGAMDGRALDLAVVDVETGRITRIAERTPVYYYAWSPDGRRVAYTVIKGALAGTFQSVYDIVVHDLAAGTSRTLAKNARLRTGTEWRWAPDGRSIAYVSGGQLANGEIVVLPAGGGQPRVLGDTGAPRFDSGARDSPPRWSADGAHLYALADGEVWRADPASGRVERVAAIPGWRITSIVATFARPTAWTTDGGRTLWVLGRSTEGARVGIHAVDLETGRTRSALEEAKGYSPYAMALAASDATGEIAFVSSDQQHLHDVWLLDTATGQTRRGTRLNEELDRYELGSARIIEWSGPEDRRLRGALLLPPGYRDGQRLPLVVWVYGGAMGSNRLHDFGFSGGSPVYDMHVLATRGYAVLSPDAPLREGRTMADIVATVMPGVDAAIEQGYADPDRLAVMGRSYGAYSTLSLITQTPRFKAAVIAAAVTHPDLFADYLRETAYYEHGQGNMGGSIWEYRDRYFENSPLFLFDRIETPLLIGQGEKDGDLVPADAIFAALERLGKPVEYRLYEGEPHAIQQTPHVVDFWQRRLDFLAEHLRLARDDLGRVVLDRVSPRTGTHPPPTP